MHIYIIYVYIYIVAQYIYISRTVYNGENTSKNDIIIPNEYRPWLFSKDMILNVIYNKIFDNLFDVSWLMYVRFLVHMQKEESKVNIAGTA